MARLFVAIATAYFPDLVGGWYLPSDTPALSMASQSCWVCVRVRVRLADWAF